MFVLYSQPLLLPVPCSSTYFEPELSILKAAAQRAPDRCNDILAVVVVSVIGMSKIIAAELLPANRCQPLQATLTAQQEAVLHMMTKLLLQQIAVCGTVTGMSQAISKALLQNSN